MKLAEALQERADLNRKIEELRRRLNNCILVQEGLPRIRQSSWRSWTGR